MPNTEQAKKRLRQDEKRRMLNKKARTSMRTEMKRVFQAESAEEAQKAIPQAMKKIDKAAKRHVIHANAAARLKSQVTRSANAKS